MSLSHWGLVNVRRVVYLVMEKMLRAMERVVKWSSVVDIHILTVMSLTVWQVSVLRETVVSVMGSVSWDQIGQWDLVLLLLLVCLWLAMGVDVLLHGDVGCDVLLHIFDVALLALESDSLQDGLLVLGFQILNIVVEWHVMVEWDGVWDESLMVCIVS